MEIYRMKRRALVFTALVCLLINNGAAAAASAPPPAPRAAKDTWTSVRSKNFYLIGNASEREIKQVATRMEQFRYVFTQLLPGMNFTSPVPTTIVVFKSDSSYKPYKPVVDGKVSEVAGYFQPGRDVNYITLTTEKRQENPYATIFHEYVHLLVNNTLGEANVPTWFNEGLAEYYSTFDIEDDQKVFLGNLISGHLQLLREQKLLPLKTLFRIDNYALHRTRREAKSYFYAESWALVHYLILGNDGRRVPQMGQFLNMLMKNKPVEQAFEEAFKTDFAAMEKELKNYIDGGRYMGKVATFKNKLVFETEMQAAPVAEADALAHLGDLLLHTNRPEDADARLTQALALDPNHALALASLGMVRMRQKRVGEARELLRKAAEAGTQNYLAHYYYAYALSREGMDDAESVSRYSDESTAVMRAELKKAIELKPNFPESYYLLAFVNMVTGQLDEAASLMKKALQISPGNETYSFALAQVYMHKGDYEPAKILLTNIAQSGSEPQLRATAQSMLDAIANMQARRARAGGDEPPVADSSAQNGRDNPRPPRGGEGPPTADNAPGQNTGSGNKSFDQSSALREVLRPARDGERRVQGVLVRIDCDARGIVFTVRVEGALLKLHAAKFEDMDISTYTQEVGGEITCGVMKKENTVVMTYRPSAASGRARLDGEAVALEFVPKDFVLEKK
jgi:FimV-like protein